MINNKWLLKTEPKCWSWYQQLESKVCVWDGVRNYQAQKNLKQMKINDLAFFYHTGINPHIIGIIKVISEWSFEDETNKDNKFGKIEVETFKSLPKIITLKEIKYSLELSKHPLIKQPRLSIMPISNYEWEIILNLSI